MTNAYNVLILPGDGIGPEVMGEVRRLVDWFGNNRDFNANLSEDLVGGAALEAHGTAITDEAMDS